MFEASICVGQKRQIKCAIAREKVASSYLYRIKWHFSHAWTNYYDDSVIIYSRSHRSKPIRLTNFLPWSTGKNSGECFVSIKCSDRGCQVCPKRTIKHHRNGSCDISSCVMYVMNRLHLSSKKKALKS